MTLGRKKSPNGAATGANEKTRIEKTALGAWIKSTTTRGCSRGGRVNGLPLGSRGARNQSTTRTGTTGSRNRSRNHQTGTTGGTRGRGILNNEKLCNDARGGIAESEEVPSGHRGVTAGSAEDQTLSAASISAAQLASGVEATKTLLSVQAVFKMLGTPPSNTVRRDQRRLSP